MFWFNTKIFLKIVCVFVSVCTCVCVFECMWRQEVNIVCLFSIALYLTFLRQGLTFELGTWWGSLKPSGVFYLKIWGCKCTLLSPTSYFGPGDMNSGSHACTPVLDWLNHLPKQESYSGWRLVPQLEGPCRDDSTVKRQTKTLVLKESSASAPRIVHSMKIPGVR